MDKYTLFTADIWMINTNKFNDKYTTCMECTLQINIYHHDNKHISDGLHLKFYIPKKKTHYHL
jgi:hypothetical protein